MYPDQSRHSSVSHIHATCYGDVWQTAARGTVRAFYGWYVRTNDLQPRNNGGTKGILVPVGLRLRYVIVKPKNSWTFYAEDATSVYDGNWTASAVKSQVRLNVSFTIPVGWRLCPPGASPRS